jgi:hypothetical protein
MEECRMSQRKLHHLLDARQLLLHTTEVVISDEVDVPLAFLSLDWVYDFKPRGRHDDTRLLRLQFIDLKGAFITQ